MNLGDGNIVVGALVQWTGAKTYGVIIDRDSGKIYVRWDNSGPPSQFAISDPPLARVNLQGQPVKLMSSGETAAALQAVATDTPAWKCFVASNGGRTINVPEADLRPVAIIDPIDRFKANIIGSMKQYRLQEVTRWYRLMHLYDELVSLGHVGVDIQTHQVAVVHKVISNYPHRFLLCDEVGLGKTIEAGMVLKELRARGGAQRVLAIVPPSIVRQWQFEMKSKFNEAFSVLNTRTVRHLEDDGYSGNPFAYRESVLCSSGWIANPKWAELCVAVDWDLIIMDEAHHARRHRSGETTRLYRLIRDLAEPRYFARRAMLFLTATPMQLDTHELYSLVELIDPALFPSEEHFERHRREAPGLSRLAELLSKHGFPLPDEDPDETVRKVAKWLELDENTARQRLMAGSEERRALVVEMAHRHLLSEVMIRNRKAVIGGFMPRAASRWSVELTVEEQTALQAVEEYVEFGFKLAEGAHNSTLGFVMVTFQKLMASSMAAIKESLSKRREKVKRAELGSSDSDAELEERLGYDDNASEVVGAAGGGHLDESTAELALLDRAIAFLDHVTIDSKARVLIEELSKLFDDDLGTRVLLFTQFRETQRFLAEQLAGEGWGVNVFHGQMSPQEKDNSVERFRNGAGPQVLISTEAGGEGRNFQFCHILVNYDLPWNPMRVEQRIGRVDRFGQKHAVSIFNLWVKDTIEERVLDVLENRIRVFEETVGGLDPILGDTESDITRILRIAGQKQEEAFKEFGRQMEERVRRARAAESQLGDFIMDTKSYRKEIAERIAGQPSPIDNDDLERFIGQLLADARTYIRRRGDIYELTFNGEILESERKYLAGRQNLRAVFRADHRPDSEDVEFMAFGHPIVDSITAQVLAEDYGGVTGTRRILAGDDLPPCSGWLFTYQFTIPGTRSAEQLEPIFVSDKGTESVDIGRSLVARAYRFDSDEADIQPSEIPDNLDIIQTLADQFATLRRKEIQRQAEEQAAGRVDTEVSRLVKWFDYRERVAKDRVVSTQATLNRIRESGDESQRQILPVWEANLRRDNEILTNLIPERSSRIAEAERHRHPQVAWSLKSLGRIEVVAAEDGDDPDAELELRADTWAELQVSLAAEVSSMTSSAEEVARRQGLSW
jgi:SNF2 family DNA or RNA helicase